MTKSLLAKEQIRFLEFVGAEPQLFGRFYFSGGTALCKFYLQHRFSEDLDFFAENEFDAVELNQFLLSRMRDYGANTLQYQQSFNRNLFFLNYGKGQPLKVEFTYYPFPRIETGVSFGNLAVDSVLDIAVNKAFTLAQKARGRDYFDLFEINQKYNYNFVTLLKLARQKFDSPINYLQLGKNLVKVSAFLDDPILIKQIDKKIVEEYFLNQARQLSILT
ncbi:MAG: nucleotidyl transferase AbiEii/AbiGii toxin family protein [Synergistaceae bacterium]|nr:nucleotidyl transferase AbiEii/AbiGii toxin family protein [Synergistaceae bacterium]